MTGVARPRGVARSVLGRALGGIARIDPGRRDVVGVLTYHRIVAPGTSAPPGIASASAEGFRRQMELLASAYHPIGLGDLVGRADGAPALPRRSVLVTFDDGYRDTASVAWPILRELGIPAALFVPTAMPDSGRRFWWTRLYAAISDADRTASWESPIGPLSLMSLDDRDAAYRRLRARVKELAHDEATTLVSRVEADLGAHSASGRPDPGNAQGDVLDWSELATLATEGMALAAHTRTHPLLTQVPPSELDPEIGGSVQDLADRLGMPPTAVFAYPSGAHSAAVREAAARNGIRVAFTTDRGLNDLGNCDWLALRRINVGARTDGAWLRAQLGNRTGPWVAAIADRRDERRSAAGTSAAAPSGRG